MKAHLLLGLIGIIILAGCTTQTQDTGETNESTTVKTQTITPSNTVYFAVSDYKLSKLDLNISHPLIAERIRWNTTQIPFYSKIKDDINYPNIKYGISSWNNSTKTIQFIETETPENAYFVIRYAVSGELNKPLEGFTVILGEAKVDHKNTGLVNLTKSADMVFTPIGGCADKVTAVHELGHILGLGHSPDYKSVMFSSVDCKGTITDEMKKAVEILYSTKEIPDLYFSSIDAKKTGQKVEINLTISNRGIITSQNTSVTVKVNNKAIGTSFEVPQIKGGGDWWKMVELQDPAVSSIMIEISPQNEFDTENNIINLQESPKSNIENIVSYKLDDKVRDNLILYGKTVVTFEYNGTCTVCLSQKKYLEDFARKNNDQIILEIVENSANPTSNITFESKKGAKELDTVFTDYYVETKESKGSFQIGDGGVFKKQVLPSYENRTFVDPSTIDIQVELCRFMLNPAEICNNELIRSYNNVNATTH